MQCTLLAGVTATQRAREGVSPSDKGCIVSAVSGDGPLASFGGWTPASGWLPASRPTEKRGLHSQDVSDEQAASSAGTEKSHSGGCDTGTGPGRPWW